MGSHRGSHSLILLLIIFGVASAQVALESFRRCVVEEGISPDLIHSGNSSLYADLDHRWNTRPVHTHPLAYFVPRVTSDVQIGVRCARANNIPVIPKSGGHSAELLSFGNPSTIVISFQNMKKIQINATESTAVIESGALIGEIVPKLLSEGGFGLSTGSCADVGIGGIALGGGEGITAPLYNLTVDNILEMEMVDANGDRHLVNENVNSDLYWALRGVGSGYIGIVTSFKFKLFNATDLKSTTISFSFDLDNMGPVLLAYQDWFVWGGKEGLNFVALLNVEGAAGQVTVRLTLQEEISSGQPTNVELFLNKIEDIFPPLENQNLTATFPSYAEMTRDMAAMEFISVNAQPATYVKKKSFFVNRTFSAVDLEKVIQILRKGRNLNVQILFYGFSGAVHKIPATDMAYVHRNYLYQVSPRVVAPEQVSATEAQLALDWVNEFVTEAESTSMDNGESYQNYVDLDLADRFMEKYYGVNSQRLIEIKTKWDPDNYFRNELSIPTANAAATSQITLPSFLFCLCVYLICLFV